ncbi:hypothetical protein DL89DRAFT_121244 [Linderina pennispora]|uniref:Uncharacterized protein n=1 Tax=Linderina pennispora TaxID=61395 RepID=A0A1Y1WD71_9FUNG|nr:uncharacterized protein DL89DRAFT_121244 [Linderina pennispora]ORX71186.1 hypothetical protein DL89DRAFT_121244 [Linderina pennispora]
MAVSTARTLASFHLSSDHSLGCVHSWRRRKDDFENMDIVLQQRARARHRLVLVLGDVFSHIIQPPFPVGQVKPPDDLKLGGQLDHSFLRLSVVLLLHPTQAQCLHQPLHPVGTDVPFLKILESVSRQLPQVLVERGANIREPHLPVVERDNTQKAQLTVEVVEAVLDWCAGKAPSDGRRIGHVPNGWLLYGAL